MGAALSQGEVVLARYRLEEKLGEGGMGVVWAASHVVTHKRVALKILKVKTDENVWRFFREARIAGELRHPRLVDVSDLLRLDDGTPVMVMELLRGQSLGALLATGNELDYTRIAMALADVADTLADVHEGGVVHRDLKPENIFIEETGAVKILDFGVAKLSQEQVTETIDGMTQTGSVVGTPAYMAPEQVFGEKDVDARADAWAFGAIVFEVFAGRRLVQADNFGQAFKAITMGDIPRLREVAPQCSARVAALVDGMLTRDRAVRFADFRAAAVQLREVASGVASSSLPAAGGRRRRQWVLAAAFFLIAIAGVGASIVALQSPATPTVSQKPIVPLVFAPPQLEASQPPKVSTSEARVPPSSARAEPQKGTALPPTFARPLTSTSAPGTREDPRHGGISTSNPYDRR
jgi:serine/threonine-protein kinase